MRSPRGQASKAVRGAPRKRENIRGKRVGRAIEEPDFLPIRFEPPSYAFAVVETRVVRSLLSTPLSKISTIIAPPGFGKTVTMSQLYRRLAARGAYCLWVGLDDRPIGLSSLLSAIEEELKLKPRNSVAPPGFNSRNVSARIERVLDALASQQRETVLLFDNLNACADPDLTLLMDSLVFCSADGVHVIASSTRRIDFDLGRAQVEMRLRRLTPSELSFSPDEIMAFLKETGRPALSDDMVRAVIERTEGWPAAVRLAQLVLSNGNSEVGAFTGGDQDFAALLSRRLMASLDADLVHFMRDIAVLGSFCAELAVVATGDSRAEAWIRYLFERHVLIVPLDRSHTWFRFHLLLREFLLADASVHSNTERRRIVATRAAVWLFEHDRFSHALELALLAKDKALIASLLENVAEPMVRDRGDLSGFIDLVRRSQDAGASPGGDTLIWYAWAQAFSRDYAGAKTTIRRISDVSRSGDEDATRAGRLRARRRMAEIIISYHLDDLAVVLDLAPRWLASTDDECDAFDVAAVAAALALAFAAQQDRTGARQALRRMLSAILSSQSEYGRIWAILVSATVELAQGDPAAAEVHLRSIGDAGRRNLGSDAGIMSVFALVEARIAADQGRTAEALALIREWLPKGIANGIMEITWLASEVAIHAIGAADAPFTFEELLVFAKRFSPRLTFLLQTAMIRRLLRIDSFEEAHELCERLQLISPAGAPLRLPANLTAMEISAARIAILDYLISAGKCSKAADVAAMDPRPGAKNQGRRELIERRLFDTTIALREGNESAAHAHFGRAVTLGARQRLMSPFLNQAKLVREIVASNPAKRLGLVFDADIVFFQELTAAVRVAGPTSALARPESLAPHGNVTPREAHLLRMLDAGLDNAQIASHLSLSVPTVKWHLSNIYAKLGVKNRSAALSRARQLHLLG